MPKYVVLSRDRASAVGELLAETGGGPQGNGTSAPLVVAGLRRVAAQNRRGGDVAESRRHWDGAGVERKIRATGRSWTVGDITMVADGQWAVGARSGEQRHDEETVMEDRIADGRRVELTLDELARAVGSRIRGDRRDEDLD